MAVRSTQMSAEGNAADSSESSALWTPWQGSLEDFAVTTGLSIAGFEPDGTRRFETRAPTGNALWTLLSEQPGSGRAEWHAFERDLIAACVRGTSSGVEARFHDLFRVRALPITHGGELRAVISFGWVPDRFGTAFDALRLARAFDLDESRVLEALRETLPIGRVRFDTFGTLLETLVAGKQRHLEAIGMLEAQNRTRELLLAHVSHELRTPLMTSSLRLQQLLDSDLRDERVVRRQLQQLRSTIADEARLVEDLIETARTRTGQLSIALAPTRLVPLLEQALEELAPRLEAKHIGVSLQVDGAGAGEPAARDTLSADAVRLRQVFGNLLANAVKFTPARGRIDVAVANVADELEVRVADTGCGIAAELLVAVFDPFTQAQPGSHRGMGLGLSVARQLVQLHGGRIWAESAGLDRGATFVVRLPRHTPPPAPTPTARSPQLLDC
ncbi:MAG: HAMP domain-containing sensor histidine kinase [Polyangiales bacterium]